MRPWVKREVVKLHNLPVFVVWNFVPELNSSVPTAPPEGTNQKTAIENVVVKGANWELAVPRSNWGCSAAVKFSGPTSRSIGVKQAPPPKKKVVFFDFRETNSLIFFGHLEGSKETL